MEYIFSHQKIQTSQVLVLLDLNLPVLNGYQVLKQMKSDYRTKHMPVVILTTSEDPAEIDKCYRSGCNLYIIKPLEYDQFAKAIQHLGHLFSIIKLPEKQH